MLHRRTFIGTALSGLVGGWMFDVRGGIPARGTALPSAFDEVDRFAYGHALRDGARFRTPPATEQHDVVIVGGGISGLTALYRLSDLDVVLLEKEPEPGGNSRRRRADGVEQPLGAIVSRGPVAPFTGFFDELGVRFERLPGPVQGYHIEGQLVCDPLGVGSDDLPLSAAERDGFRAVARQLEALLDPTTGVAFPRADNPPEVRALDRITLADWYQRSGLPEAVRRYLDLLVSARLGTDGASLSAWYALYVLSELRGPTYSLPGGHGAIAERLAALGGNGDPRRLRTGVMVTQVENRPGGGVRVSGLDADGTPFSIAARCAVIAAPKMLTKYLVPGLREARPGLYDPLRYNGYLVARVTLAERRAAAFEIACADLFSRFVVATDWLPSNRSPAGLGCLNVYVPYPDKAGRAELLAADARTLAARIIADLDRLYPGAGELVRELRLHRWGHPMITPTPGMDTTLERLREPFGDVIFAHSDTFGIAGLHSAVWTGMDAESEVRLALLGSG